MRLFQAVELFLRPRGKAADYSRSALEIFSRNKTLLAYLKVVSICRTKRLPMVYITVLGSFDLRMVDLIRLLHTLAIEKPHFSAWDVGQEFQAVIYSDLFVLLDSESCALVTSLLISAALLLAHVSKRS